MENLEDTETVAVSDDTPTDVESEEWEADLSNEQIQQDIDDIKERLKDETDAKEKRHKEQEIGWKMKIIKDREKANKLEEANNKLESRLVEEVYDKATTDWFGIWYFEKIYKDSPDLAEKVAKTKFGLTAKQLIKRETWGEWIDEEEAIEKAREKVYKEMAIEAVEDLLNKLNKGDREAVKNEFDDITEWKKLTPKNVKKYFDMSKNYVLGRPTISNADKDRVLAKNATTWIWWKTAGGIVKNIDDIKSMRQNLLNAGISEYQVKLMYPEI